MLMKTTTNTTAKALGIFGMLCSTVCAGSVVDGLSSARPETGVGGFDRAIRPITNPTLFDLALPTTNIHPIFLHHAMPDQISLAGGGTAPLGGDAQLYALQFEYALSERLSIVATKDGYADMDFDNTLTDSSGALVSRRVLTSEELSAPADTIAAGQELPLQVLLRSTERPVTGYTIEIFYP